MSGKSPPKAPPPILGEVTHFSVELNWAEYIERLREVYTKEDGKILIEIQQKHSMRDDWNTIYSGYDLRMTSMNLDPETTYFYRMRFKNKHGWGDLSQNLNVTTLKQPLTGEDIHKAIRMNDDYELRRVLDKGEANIEAQDSLGFTPLMSTAQKGLKSLLLTLIEYKADIECKNDSGKNALMLAAFKGQVECLEVLLQEGASVSQGDKSGLSALHYAVDGEHVGAIRVLVSTGMDINCRDSVLGWTPLIRCAGLKNNGNPIVARELLRNGAQVDLQDKDGKSALHNAIINGHYKLVDLLLTDNASLDLETMQGHSSLELAEAMDNRSVKTVILEHLEKRGVQVHPGTLKKVKHQK